jgi:uncharacterized protein YcbK (DUF882 family)
MKRPDDGKLDEPISRRLLLKIGALTTASLLIPGAALAEDWIRIPHERMPIEPVQRPIVRRSGVRQSGYTIRKHPSSESSDLTRTLSMYNVHTGENLNTTYWEYGGYVPGALEEVNYFFRDFRANQVKPIDPALLDILHSMHRQLDTSEPIHLVSGYRSPATNRWLASFMEGVAPHSMHIEGKAADINIPGRQLSFLQRVALALQGGGVGYYPRSGFVHVDTGRVRRW